MKKLENYIVLFLFSLFAVACEMDNYDGPDAGIQGVIYDITTGKPLQVDHGAGIIRMRELSWAKGDTLAHIGNRNLSVMQDGTYKNTKLFSGEYLMLPNGGPFFPYDDENRDHDEAGELVKIKGTITKDFEVTPFLTLTWVEKPTVLPDNKIRCVVRFKRNQKMNSLTGEFYDMPSVKEAWLQVSRVTKANARDLSLYPRQLLLTNDMEGRDLEFVSEIPVKFTGRSYFIRVVMNCQTNTDFPTTSNYPGVDAWVGTTVEEVKVP
jgi:hypothetical protein